MNYHNILHDDMLNGSGLRVVLFVSGCEHKCPECQNPQTHDFQSGLIFSEIEKEEIFSHLKQPYTKGLTLTGGDPFHPDNAFEILKLCKEVKLNFPFKDIWVYTGYNYSELCETAKKCLKYIDVLVDGRFKKDLADVNAPYIGSTNQRIIDVQATLTNGKITLYNT